MQYTLFSKSQNINLYRKEEKIMEITKETVIGDVLDFNAEAAAPFFFEMGMHCLGCPSARGESIEQACAVHGVDADELVAKLNEAVNK